MAKTLAILVGGSPASGINEVTGATTIRVLPKAGSSWGRARLRMEHSGQLRKVGPADLEQVSQFHFRRYMKPVWTDKIMR